MDVGKFDIKDLLDLNELKALKIQGVCDRSKAVTKKLIKYIFYFRCVLYTFDSNLIIYQKVEHDEEDQLISVISEYIYNSIEQEKKTNKKYFKSEEFRETYWKFFLEIQENSFIRKMLPQIKIKLIQTENLFSPDYYQIHYTNGFIDMKTKEFKNRVIGEHFVRAYIHRDYIPSTEAQRNKLLSSISKIYRNKEDLDAILYILGSSLTGKSTREQKILFLLGLGSSGKSTILSLTEKAIETYFQALEEDAFSNSNSNKDKTFSTFADAEHIRLILTNEPRDDSMNVSSFKQFCEGHMKGKLLYKNGVHTFNHNGLPVFTSNTMPNIKMDSGVERRICALEHKSKFTSNKKEVDESKGIYFKDRDLIDNIVKEGLLDAWIDILVLYGHKWLNGEQPDLPASFQQMKEHIVDVNDIYQDLLDSKFVISGLSKDRVGKYRMEEIFKEMYAKRSTTQQIMRDKLREKKIEYNKDLRGPDGVRGVYVGLREKLDRDNDDGNKPNEYGFAELLKEDQKLSDALETIKKTIGNIKFNVEFNVKLFDTPVLAPCQDANADDDLVDDSVLDAEQAQYNEETHDEETDSSYDDDTELNNISEMDSLLLEF